MNSTSTEWATRDYRGGEAGLRIVQPDSLVCFMVDSYPIRDSDKIRCDNKLDKPPQLTFDYSHDIKKSRSEMEAAFLSVILKHLQERPFSSDTICISDISKYFDPSEYLRKRFGLLNTNSKEYTNLLEGVQEGLQEELEEKVADINNFLKHRSWRNVEEQLKEISLRFQPSFVGFVTEKDPRNFQTPHCLGSPIDAYKLPRIPTEHISKYLDVETPKNGLLTKDIVNNPVVCNAMRILLKNSLGICPKRLQSELERTHRRKINIEEFLNEHSFLFQVVKSRNFSLVFPKWGRDIVEPYSLAKRIFHKVVVLLKLSEDDCIPMKEIPTRLNSILGIRFNPYAWGSNSEEEFFKNLLRDYDVNDEIEIFQDSYLRLMVLPESDPVSVFLEELGVKEIKKIQTKIMIPQVVEPLPENLKFVSTNVEIPSVAGHIKKGKTYFVLPDFMRTPAEFYVSLEQHWVMRNAFVKEMTTKYEKWNSDPDFSSKITVLPDFLKKNSYVAVKSQDEWVRGRIIRHYERLYAIFLIDLGYEIDGVSASDMKYLHREFAYNFPAQVFPCSFRRKQLRETFPGMEGSGSIGFPERTLEKFYDLLMFNTFGIVTLNRAEHSGFWIVDGFLVDNVEDRNIIVPDLVTELVEKHSLHWRKPRFSKTKLSRKWKK